LNLNQRSISSW